MDDEPLLEARELRAQINHERSFTVSLRLAAGQALQVTGPSGAGKSTLLRMLARLEAHDGGELLLRGQPGAEVPAPSWRRQVVYLAQQPTMLEGTVRDNLAAGFQLRGVREPEGWEQRGRELLTRLQLEPDGELWRQQAATLSGGEAARVALVRALLIEPPVLLADELTAALDLEAARALVQLLGKWTGGGGGLVFVAHDPAPWEGLKHGCVELER